MEAMISVIDRGCSIASAEIPDTLNTIHGTSGKVGLHDIVLDSVASLPHSSWKVVDDEKGNVSYYVDLPSPKELSSGLGYLVVTQKTSAASEEETYSARLIIDGEHSTLEGGTPSGTPSGTPNRWRTDVQTAQMAFERLQGRDELYTLLQQKIQFLHPSRLGTFCEEAPDGSLKRITLYVPDSGHRYLEVIQTTATAEEGESPQKIFHISTRNSGEPLTLYESDRAKELFKLAIHENQIQDAFDHVKTLGSLGAWKSAPLIINKNSEGYWGATVHDAGTLYIPKNPSRSTYGNRPILFENGRLLHISQNEKLGEQALQTARDITLYRATPKGKISGAFHDLLGSQKLSIRKESGRMDKKPHCNYTLFIIDADTTRYAISCTRDVPAKGDIYLLRLVDAKTDIANKLTNKPFEGKDIEALFHETARLYAERNDKGKRR